MSDPEAPSSAASVVDKQQPITPSSSSPLAPNIDPLSVLQQPPPPSPAVVTGDPFVSPLPAPFEYHKHLDSGVTNPKRPRYVTSSSGSQWKQLLPSPTSAQTPLPLKQQVQKVLLIAHTDTSSPSSSTNPAVQVLQTRHLSSATAAAAASSSDTAASSPSHDKARLDQQQQHSHGHGQLRKGKHVSPVWKPYEMLILARGWHIQYKSSSRSGSDSGRGNKSRAEKDREVAEFLNRHGVERDAKAAGTKWDNMLGDFRKVYLWERGGGRIEAGVAKSYFRLSPYERKNQYGLPTSFDEEVFEEMAQFMGPRMRSSSSSSLSQLKKDDDGGKGSGYPLPSLTFKDKSELPLSASLMSKQVAVIRSSGGDQSLFHEARGVVNIEPSSSPRRELVVVSTINNPITLLVPESSSVKMEQITPLRRIGKMKMTWEESVSLWAEEGETERGRVKIGLPMTTASPSSCHSFLNADELVFFDDSMVASSLEAFENGPLRGFSVDMFTPGLQLKVFGRRKAAAATGRAQLLVTEPSIRSSELLECQDPSEYYLGRLKISPAALPTLSELSLYLHEPPYEELKFPLRRDVYRDLPQGKELFFTTSSELLDCRMITYNILGPVLGNFGAYSTPSSRDSYIALWDDCINRVVSQFCSLEMVFVRKPPAALTSQSTEILWPNFTGFIGGLCLWRGEETDQVREGETEPSTLLLQKLLWSYADLPYVLGYYAVGCTVTLCALSRRSQDNQVLCTDLISMDLTSPAGRLKSLIPCWRIASLLPLLAEKCLSYGNTTVGPPLFSDFERIALGNGDIIERTPDSQIRYFSNKRRWGSVKEIYDFLDRRIPHSEYMAGSCEGQLSVTFKPRGCRVGPRSVEQLIEALKSVTKSLVALHDLSFMHRDVSWDTVTRRVECNETKAEWILSGFDAAAGAPQMSAFFGDASGAHAPEMRRGLHSVKVDVWGVGWLIKTSGLVGAMLPIQLRDLQSRCLEHNQEMRPTAADCYHHLLQLSAAAAAAAGGQYHLNFDL